MQQHPHAYYNGGNAKLTQIRGYVLGNSIRGFEQRSFLISELKFSFGNLHVCAP